MSSFRRLTANHEGRDDAKPDVFDIAATRGLDAPLTFGAGAHFCMGASLGRAELQDALSFLARHMVDLRLDAEPEYGTPMGLYGVRQPGAVDDAEQGRVELPSRERAAGPDVAPQLLEACLAEKDARAVADPLPGNDLARVQHRGLRSQAGQRTHAVARKIETGALRPEPCGSLDDLSLDAVLVQRPERSESRDARSNDKYSHRFPPSRPCVVSHAGFVHRAAGRR